MATKIIEWKPDADTDELVQMYVAQTGHAYHVCAAFVMLDREPPSGHGQGFSARESAIIQEHYDRYDPHGSRAHSAKIKAELGDD